MTIYIIKTTKKFEQFDDVKFFSEQTYTDLGPQLSLCWKQLTMNIWGRWSLEILTLMASYLSPEAIAAQSCMNSISNMARMVQ